MKTIPRFLSLLAVLVTFLLVTPAWAVTIEYVTVGNPGNAADTTGYGAVPYSYRIGKYEVTNAQYAEFLNAKGESNSNGIYNASMVGYGIAQTGSSGSYTYSVTSGLENHPVVYVSWYDAARYTNWLGNGQGGGSMETGAYTLSGNTGMIIVNPGATVYLPSENEWYKAAYYNGGTSTYSLYPNGQNTITPADANSNYNVAHSTDVGSYSGDPSSYGTFDQGGNVSEWNDAVISGSYRGLRGGAWNRTADDMLSSDPHGEGYPTAEGSGIGFRVASAAFTITLESANYGLITGNADHYLPYATATLTATPNPGYLFAGWTGNATGNANPLSVLMNADKTIGATFSPDISDTDGDGWTNYQEIVEYGTDPTKPDTDGDGVKDSKDDLPLDPTETLDSDHDGIGDNTEADDDNDGLSDVDELTIYGTNPKRADSDGDGLSDPDELQVYLTNPMNPDMDNDGLKDGAEVNTYLTLPKVADTDGDGFLDGYEVVTGHLPLVATDKPALVADARTAIEFTFTAAIGKTYRIEASLDLATWTTVEDGIAGNGTVIQRFYTTRDMPKRYFRVEESGP